MSRRSPPPETVRILGITYEVRRKALPDDEDAYIEPRKQRIVLGRHLSAEKARQVLVHEVVHGILDQLGYLDLYEDERLVQGLAIGLHEAFATNRGVAELADARAPGARGETRAGSTPAAPTDRTRPTTAPGGAASERRERMLERFRQMVADYYNDHADATDARRITTDDVFVVWSCKTLQNWKALLSTTVPDLMYYELTYDGDKQRTYLDAYRKWENVTIPDEGGRA